MNIAVTGHKGMLGQAVVQEVMKQDHVLRIFQTESWNERAVRIEDIEPKMLEGIDVIINCAGLVPQREGYEAQDLIYTNGIAPHILAKSCDQHNVRLIHVSTDCVFSLPGPHTEASPISPHGLYGISKAAGEVFRSPHLTVRTSFVGKGGYGLLAQLQDQAQVHASRRLLWSGHTAPTVARFLVLLAGHPEVTGLLHMPGDWTNRYDLVKKLASRFGLEVEIIEKNDLFSDRRLLSSRWSRIGLPSLPNFDEELSELKL